MGYDYRMEKKLQKEAPELHCIFSANVLCCQNMLLKYQSIFPNYTDHTVLHSLEVIAFCNELVAENVEKMNPDEIFILLMAAYLHDSGMGVNKKDMEAFIKELPQMDTCREIEPEISEEDLIRIFHHELSGCYIRKYASVFDFPSKDHLWAIIQTSRGHRKTDLYDEKEYPAELRLPNGNVVHLPYLAALIRMADELDIAADRNIQFLYDISSIRNEVSRMEFRKHMAIKAIGFEEDALRIDIDFSDEKLKEPLKELLVKLECTLHECVGVIEKRTPFEIHQKKIHVEAIK